MPCSPLRAAGLLLGCFLWLVGPLAAQEPPLTFERALSLAREQSPELQARQATVRSLEAREKGAGSFPNPLLHLSGVVGTQTESDQYISQPLDPFDIRGASADLARAERLVAQARLDVSGLELDREVGLLYVQALAEQRRVESHEQSLQLAGKVAEIARRRYDAGVSTILPMLRAEQERADQEQELLTAREHYDRSRASLRIRLALPTLPTLTGEAPPLPVARSTSDWLAMAEESHPEMLLARQSVAVPAAEADVANAGRLPTLDLEGYRQSPFSGPGGVRLVMEVPLFDYGSIRGKVAEADQRRLAAEAEVEAKRREVATRVEVAEISLKTAELRRQAWQESVARSDRLLELALRGFEGGVTPYLELLEAQRTVSRARLEAVGRDEAVQRSTIEFWYSLGGRR